jgi:hypothetical protein
MNEIHMAFLVLTRQGGLWENAFGWQQHAPARRMFAPPWTHELRLWGTYPCPAKPNREVDKGY